MRRSAFLPDATDFRDLVSGRRRGLRADLLRALLRLAEFPYTASVQWRNRRYDRREKELYRPAVPVVSVGNLTMGGTGKTPVVRWIARWLRGRGARVTLISRGYGADEGARNDEALELEEHLPDVPHLQDPDRIRAAKTAIEELDAQLILLDDAFQHRRIARDLDIVLVDALEPFGYGHVFPRGMLREPISGLARAGLIGLSRADQVEASQKDSIRKRIAQHNRSAAWIELAHVPSRLCSAGSRELPVDALANQPVAAFCGIGNPDGFRRTLETCNYKLRDLRVYPDHHAYTRSDVEQLTTWAAAMHDIAAVLCTRKDFVKIGLERLGRKRLWSLAIDAQVLAGQVELERELQRLVDRIQKPVPG